MLVPGIALVAVLLVLVLSSRGEASRRATPEDLVSARLVAAARRRHFEDERQERFRRYHQTWSTARRRVLEAGVRRYVLPFAAEVRRG